MTRYTTVIITGIEADDEDLENELELINAYLTSVEKRVLDELTPSISSFNGQVYGASINYLNELDFLEFCKTIAWHIPEDLQIFIRTEDESIYRVLTIKDL